MNSENFHEYLKNPSMLHQISYQELKSLMLQYPYAVNLRYLMVVKSLFDQHRDYDRNLVLAALGSLDRTLLSEMIKQFTQAQETHDNISLGEEFLELKDLSTLEVLTEDTPQVEPGKFQILETDKNAEAPDPSLHRNISDEEDLEFLDEWQGGAPPEEPLLRQEEEQLGPEGELPLLEQILEEAQPGETESPDYTAHENPFSFDTEELFEDLHSGSGTTTEIDESGNLTNPASSQPEWTAEPDMLNEEIRGMQPIHGEGSVHETGSLEEEWDEAEETEIEVPGLPETDESASVLEDLPEVRSGEQVTGQDAGVTDELPDRPEYPVPSSKPGPTPKHAFRSWKDQLSKPGILDKNLPAIPPTENIEPEDEPYEEPPDEAREVAEKSLQEDMEIATETLAFILEKQGHLDKAIKMYEKLSLQYPQKSALFAAKIETLKKIKG